MEIKGTVIQIGEIETGQGKKEPWQKQIVVLETPGQYKRKVCVYFWGNQTDSITKVDHEVTVHVNPESREYNGRWYTELRAWKVEQVGGAGYAPPVKDDLSNEQGNRLDSSDLPF